MKLFNKTYKTYSKQSIFAECYSFKKILRFKRSKWKSTKRSLKQWKNWKLKIFDLKKVSVKSRPFPKVRKTYSTGLMLRRSLGHYTGDSINLKFLKKYCYEKNPSMLGLLIKPLYKVDILLWKLQWYKSIQEVRQDIRNRLICVNNSRLIQPCFLERGDMITFLNDRPYIRNLFRVKPFFYSFCEVDYYSQTIIIIKNQKDFLSRDILLLFKKNVNVKHLFYYLRKK